MRVPVAPGTIAIEERRWDTIRVEFNGPVALLTLHRPDAANSRNQRMRAELNTVFDYLAGQSDAKVLVLTGKGGRHFCAGMDTKEATGSSESPLERRRRLKDARDIEALASLPQITIAAINGYALGGGLEMALACDLRIAGPQARLGLPEVSIGLIPGGGATQRLPRLIGYARAAELLYTARQLDASSAERIGLVSEVVATPGDLLPAAFEMANAISSHPSSALRMAKESLMSSAELPLSRGTERELDNLLYLLAERDQAYSRG